jgi:alkanesulfonate monooxygenase SsuD/methylene tetrahydromethanopterin reductase-like flavin-dependent oxidoreductase (luciferase family)
MTAWSMRFDMRMPDFLTASAADHYRGALDLSSYAEAHGCTSIMVSEHHLSEDGYLPDALTLATAIAAVTSHAMIAIGALILPLHDPIRAAERTALLDIVSNGRVLVIVGSGYVASEFAMFGLDVHDRARLMEEKLPLYLAALSGEPFEHLGTTVRVTPRCVQRPRPVVLLGGTAPAVARRAARLADGFNPIVDDPSLAQIYRNECTALGKDPGIVVGGGEVAPVLFLADDVDAEWERLAPYLLHEANMYAAWAAAAGDNEHLYRPVEDIAGVQALQMHRVMTSDECVEYLRAGHAATFHPLAGGNPVAEAERNLRCFVEGVLPAVGP